MHEDITLTTGRVHRVLTERIRPAIHGTHVELDASWHELPGEPVPIADGLRLDFAPVHVGEAWGPAWGTTWFKLTGQVPAEWAGRKVEAVIDLGFDVNRTGFQCEALVLRGNGETIKAINPRNQWVPITDAATGGEHVELYLEAASNPVLLEEHPFLPTEQGDVRTASRAPLYRLARLDLAVFESEVHELSLDLQVLLELQEQLPAGSRRAQILAALDRSMDTLDLQDIPGTARAAREPLRTVLETPAEPSAHRLSAIGHSHIDSAWLWPVRETIRKVSRTCSSMVELLETDPDFRYGMSSAQQFEWLKEYRPQVFERVKRAVAEGRFIPLGGMWVESDTVMPSGEALARQFLYGQRFFREEFGISCPGVWLPDSFGYSPALPQLMKRAGFEWFFTQKISWNQRNVFPHHSFLWEGIDGSRIFTHFPPMDTYNAQLSGEEVSKATRQFRDARQSSGSIAPVGWGDGGGGTTREMTGIARRLADLEGSARVSWEDPDDFFSRARAEMPDPAVWVGELYLELHRATLTSQHRTKQGNRRTEQLLVEAELWASTANLRVGLPYPYEELDRLWKAVLLHQFHDILPGTSIAWVHREAVAEYERITAEAEQLIDTAVRALVGQGDTRLEVNSAFTARGALPAASIAACPEAQAEAVELYRDGADYILENSLVRLRIDERGLLTSAVDLRTGREAIAAGRAGNLLQLHQDFPNMWDAWDVDKFYRNHCTDLTELHAIRAEQGTHGEVSIHIERHFSKSTVTQRLTLAPGERLVRIDQVTDWQETEKFLKVAFPFDLHAEHTVAETQFGHQRRVTHVNTSWEAAKFETSMHRFVFVEEPGFAAALVNDSIYGYDVSRDAADGEVSTTLRLSLLRAPRYPDPRTDRGVQEHSFGLLIGTDLAETVASGQRLNSTPRTVHGARQVAPLVQVIGAGVQLSSVKLAADRSGDLVVRVYEALGRRTEARLELSQPVHHIRVASLIEDELEQVDGLAFTLRPFEVRTLRLTMT
ncbi:glycoside hydrolase family 38 C-terminal domain-containing protein [Glutamicibacter sp. PS]|uniref:alpha-mannosidase n=1 Tax=Glutamicibacter sp. PS TaxID=3075634 RepID=UPI002850E1AD|nr:glycoside hydrolase family 38 C-terminal domain-containing protein [Glutamicibacter sp. PS]MDR4533767.1 glycosyl hydrolase-related protein [Glutamicibacter sp. PS]